MSQFFRLTFKFFPGTILFPLFSAFLVVYYFISSYDFSLTALPKLMIGIATIEGLDVGKRVQLFYKAIFIFSIVFLLLNGIINVYRSDIEKRLFPLANLNYLSVFGLLLVFTLFFDQEITFVLNFFLSLFVLALIFFPFQKKLIRDIDDSDLAKRYFDIVLISLSLSYFFKDFLVFYLKLTPKLFLNELVLYIGILVVIIVGLLTRFKKRRLNYGYITLAFSFFPMVSILSREINFITLSNTALPVFQAGSVWLFLVTIIFIWLWYKSAQKRQFDSKKVLNRSVFIFLTGLALNSYYTPFLMLPEEMFELANPALSFERFFNHGELPVLESFNSHLFFELFYGFIYALLNGYNGLDFLTYNFLHFVTAILLIYIFLKRYFSNNIFTLLVVLFFPLLFDLFPVSWTMVLVIPFILNRYVKTRREADLFGLYFVLSVLVFWKIDLGYSAVISVTIILILLSVLKIIPLQSRAWLKMLVFLSLFGLVIFLLALFNNIPVWQNLKEAYYYVSSSQSFGYVNISLEYGRLFFIHYFVFPVAILVIVAFLLINLKRFLQEMPFQTLSLMFLCFFYFINFHRGLIRHGLLGSDDWVSSFAFFIIPSVIFFIPLSQKWTIARPYIFLFTAFFLTLSFSYPELKKVDFIGLKAMKQFSERDTLFSGNDLNFKRIRDNDEFVKKQTGELNEFFQSNMKNDATFYDYSNSPMLYYYLNKRVPSYFNQPLLSMHDEFLQKSTVSKLKSDDIPYVVYSNFLESWYDQQDDVPKNLRHFYIGEFIHRNYHPFAIIGKYAIWEKNDFINKLLIKKLQPITDTVDLKLNISISNEQIIYDKMWIAVEEFEGLNLNFNGKEFQPVYSFENKSVYHIDLELVDDISLNINGLTYFEVMNCQHFPDQYSLLKKNYRLKYLPAIWAAFIEKDSYDWKSLIQIPLKNELYRSLYEIESFESKKGGAFLKIEASLDWGDSGELTVIMKDAELKERGSFSFLNDKKYGEEFVIRLSSQPLWYFKDIHFIEIATDGKSTVKFVSICTVNDN